MKINMTTKLLNHLMIWSIDTQSLTVVDDTYQGVRAFPSGGVAVADSSLPERFMDGWVIRGKYIAHMKGARG